MATTKIRGDSQIMDLTVDLGRLTQPFINNTIGDWNITNGANDATITGVQDPVNAQDVATKNYVDNLMAGMTWKDPARVATTANVVLATDLEAGDTVDGVTLVAGDRILVKNQTVGTENGVYIAQATGAALRASDWPVAATVASWALFVEEGTVQADQAYVVTNDSGSDVVGTDALVFVKFASIVASPTDVFSDSPTVTNGSPTVTLANTNVVAGSLRVYLNGLRQLEGAGNDYTVVLATGVITFSSNLKNNPGQTDVVLADYRI